MYCVCTGGQLGDLRADDAGLLGNKADLALVWSLVKAVCGARVPKVLQNGLFDRFHLKRSATSTW